MQCEMCGKHKEPVELVYARVEGSLLKVCDSCARHGTFVRKVSEVIKQFEAQKAPQRTQVKVDEHEEMVVNDYDVRIKHAREKKGLTQKEFAQEINEKESLIHKIETSTIDLNLNLARKIERYLGITLIEELTVSSVKAPSQSSSESLTLGDVITFKKRKHK